MNWISAVIGFLGGFWSLPKDIFLDLIRWPNCQIVFKSGAVIKIHLKELTATRTTKREGTYISELKWKTYAPTFLFIDLSEVKSIIWLR